MRKSLPYTTQTFTIPFYQSREASRRIWNARLQANWCFNEGVRQELDGHNGRYGLYPLITKKRAEHDWLDLYANVHRYAIDCGRKAVDAFRKSNKGKQWMPKNKRKYTSPDSLFRKRNDRKRQPAIGCYGKPACNSDGSWNIGGICSVMPKTADIGRKDVKSFQIVETTKKITKRTKPEDRTYELHVQVHVAKPERAGGDVIGADVGAVNMIAIHNLDQGSIILATPPDSARRYKGDEVDQRRSVQSKRKKRSNTWKKEQRRMAKKVRKIRNCRRDFMRKSVKEGFKDAGVVAVENLHPKQMSRKGRGKTGLNRTIMYAAVGEVLSYIEWFALKHNSEFHKVAPHHTSTTCSECGHSDRNSRRSQSAFVCVNCGHESNADANASVNIAMRGAKAAGKVVSRRKEHMVPGAAMQETAMTRENQSKRSTAFRKKRGTAVAAGNNRPATCNLRI